MQQFKFDMGELSPSNGTLAVSLKSKLDKMSKWEENPLKDFDCKKKRKQNCYYLVGKEQNVDFCFNFTLVVLVRSVLHLAAKSVA